MPGPAVVVVLSVSISMGHLVAVPASGCCLLTLSMFQNDAAMGRAWWCVLCVVLDERQMNLQAALHIGRLWLGLGLGGRVAEASLIRRMHVALSCIGYGILFAFGFHGCLAVRA